ncbi:hypothetical protein PpBr36_03821 [Pyricularia pennisetigena]|uniref:hypothetical protein n=1 Tax=Pyricularia pennisetigena TaxID=1578925 RepID=UPI001151600B|nr:hypothetical protein PpBr36_03821 [Pyricularia pennisetigena]TLS30322.1 hypothetical protein PpBr36_03821 [Pyricularia pennisetigena]
MGEINQTQTETSHGFPASGYKNTMLSWHHLIVKVRMEPINIYISTDGRQVSEEIGRKVVSKALCKDLTFL